jgi:peptidoglycan/xylan/chitin deacetylase (PgdA/CDA1 family)
MKFYWVKTHWLVKKIFRSFIWNVPTSKKIVYITFDDGPTEEITNWTLEMLKNYGAKATFFCIGKNISKHPDLYLELQKQGHTVGNHTYNHLNGWQYSTELFMKNVDQCEKIQNKYSSNTDSTEKLFRPPYGKLKRKQTKFLKQKGYKIIMWDVLSADFDTKISPEKCAQNVLRNIQPGSIIIFHDSWKASTNLKDALPLTLEYLKKEGYEMRPLKFAPEPN